MVVFAKKQATTENHKAVIAIRIIPSIINEDFCISGVIRVVKTLRKYNVAFGLNTFVKKPLEKASLLLLAGWVLESCCSNDDHFDFQD